MNRSSSEKKEYTGIGVVSPETALEIGRGQTVVRFLNAEAKRAESGEPIFDTPKTLIIVAGHEGSGKSRVTRALEAATRVVVVDKDPLTNTFSDGRAEHGDPVHKAMRPVVYETLDALAGNILDADRSVILDAPFNKFEDFFHNETWVEKIKGITETRGAKIKVIWCTANPEVKKARAIARGNPQDRRRTDAEHAKLASRTDVPNIPFEHIVLDTELHDEESAKFLGAFLEFRNSDEESAA